MQSPFCLVLGVTTRRLAPRGVAQWEWAYMEPPNATHLPKNGEPFPLEGWVGASSLLPLCWGFDCDPPEVNLDD